MAGRLRAQTDMVGVEDAARYTLFFADGRLQGDGQALLVAQIRAQLLLARGATVGPDLAPRDLRDPLVVYFLLKDHVFDGRGLVVEGLPPGWPR